MPTYVFDGSLQGLLTAVFEWFERKPGIVKLLTDAQHQPSFFNDSFLVETSPQKAERVWKGLVKKLNKSWQRKFYCCFLSESPAAMQHLFDFSCYLFQSNAGAEENYGHPDVLGIARFAHSVEREKHRMEAFIRFKRTADALFYAVIDPDFNVLPLILKHFKDRYADQQWIIYDKKRHYGLWYDLYKVEEIVAADAAKIHLNGAPALLDEQEAHYQGLWKDYFKSTNIESRKNTALHVKHVPKRYWKYLTEKQMD